MSMLTINKLAPDECCPLCLENFQETHEAISLHTEIDKISQGHLLHTSCWEKTQYMRSCMTCKQPISPARVHLIQKEGSIYADRAMEPIALPKELPPMVKAVAAIATFASISFASASAFYPFSHALWAGIGAGGFLTIYAISTTLD